jgi:hypothetical protein
MARRRAPPFPPETAVAPYRGWAAGRFQHLSLLGLGEGDLKLRFDEVYVPLRLAGRPSGPELDRAAGPAAGHGLISAEDVPLDGLFSCARRVIFLGDPGAGKTTVLGKLHHHCLTRPPEELHLPPGTLPLFLRLRQVRREDLDGRPGDWLDRQLAQESGGELPADLGTRLWERGKLLLLLDGLDEMADEGLRARLCRYLDHHLPDAEPRGVRAALSCRFLGYGGKIRLGGEALTLEVCPLDAAQCRLLVRRWFQEVPAALPRFTEREADAAAERLVEALDGAAFASQRLKVLVGSPLLLTLLCIVVLQGGEMPRRRVEFYDRCLRVLLAHWSHAKASGEGRTRHAQAPGEGRAPLDLDTALAVLRSVAWEIHAQESPEDPSRLVWIDRLRMKRWRAGCAGPSPPGPLSRPHSRPPGRGGTRTSTSEEEIANPVQCVGGSTENLFVREAEDSQTERAEGHVAVQIVLLLFWIRMDPAIELDDQLALVAVEVRHKAADRSLAPELTADQLPVAQQLPERCFGVRLFRP